MIRIWGWGGGGSGVQDRNLSEQDHYLYLSLEFGVQTWDPIVAPDLGPQNSNLIISYANNWHSAALYRGTSFIRNRHPT